MIVKQTSVPFTLHTLTRVYENLQLGVIYLLPEYDFPAVCEVV